MGLSFGAFKFKSYYCDCDNSLYWWSSLLSHGNLKLLNSNRSSFNVKINLKVGFMRNGKIMEEKSPDELLVKYNKTVKHFKTLECYKVMNIFN